MVKAYSRLNQYIRQLSLSPKKAKKSYGQFLIQRIQHPRGRGASYIPMSYMIWLKIFMNSETGIQLGKPERKALDIRID